MGFVSSPADPDLFFWCFFPIFILLFLPLHVGFFFLICVQLQFIRSIVILYSVYILFCFYSHCVSVCFTPVFFFYVRPLLCSLFPFLIHILSSIFSYSKSFILFPVRFIIQRIYFSLPHLSRPLLIFSFFTSTKFSSLL